MAVAFSDTSARFTPISIVANGTLQVRNPAKWENGTTACASDSKKLARGIKT